MIDVRERVDHLRYRYLTFAGGRIGGAGDVLHVLHAIANTGYITLSILQVDDQVVDVG